MAPARILPLGGGALLLIVVVLGGLFTWGRLQPRPQGYLPTASGATAAAEPAGAVAADAPATPIRYTVDARDRERWVFFDFARGTVVESSIEALDWDIAFRRTGLLTNSGATNPAGPGGAVDLGEVTLDAAVPPARPAFTVDETDGDDGDQPVNAAISRWYRYNLIEHVVSARGKVYLVRTDGDRDALVRFESYYCDDETPGCVTFWYRLVPSAD